MYVSYLQEELTSIVNRLVFDFGPYLGDIMKPLCLELYDLVRAEMDKMRITLTLGEFIECLNYGRGTTSSIISIISVIVRNKRSRLTDRASTSWHSIYVDKLPSRLVGCPDHESLSMELSETDWCSHTDLLFEYFALFASKMKWLGGGVKSIMYQWGEKDTQMARKYVSGLSDGIILFLLHIVSVGGMLFGGLVCIHVIITNI